jgi:hypothetical protein
VRYYNNSLKISRTLKNKTEEAIGYMNLGSATTNLKRVRKYYRKSYRIIREIGSKILEMNLCANIGFLFYHRDDSYSYKHLEKSIDMYELIGKGFIEEENKITYYSLMTDLYQNMILLCKKLSKDGEMLLYVERSKSKAFVDIMAKTDIIYSPILRQHQDILEKEKDCISRIRAKQIENKLVGNTDDGKNIMEDIQRLEEVYETMEHIDSEYVFMRRGKPPALSEIRKLLMQAV